MRSYVRPGRECSPHPSLPAGQEQTSGIVESHRRSMTELSSQPGTTCLWNVGEGENLSWFGWIGTGSRPLPTWEQMGIYEVRYFQTGRKRVTANLQKLLRVLLNDPPWKTLLPPQSSRHSSGAGTQGGEPTVGPAAALADLTAPATENGQQQKANAPCP